ncbi:hypothetical protein PHMEG_00011318 [Phytophthora megakarya]|uniref:Uncharacterized protein n=1 Tax=Phytophthora megakarya TaxID=4795 RepID=A0A225WBH6_9STRA|nr:hypothetical protein PHMEG_00011318 [Phytophthora megakarya]
MHPAIIPEVVPARFSYSTTHNTSDHAFLVGIPAWSQRLAEEKYTRDGYGGLEVLHRDDGFTAVDIQELASLVGHDGDVNDLVMCARPDGPLDEVDLECMLDSLMVRRELAYILSHYRPDRLAQKVVATTTFLKRLLDKFRHLHAQVEAKHRTHVQDMLDS